MRTLNKIQTALLALVIMVTIPFSAYAIDGQRKISQTPSTTFPITINQSGSYVLTSNLVVTDPDVIAIQITVNDVTFDLNGHFIQGPNTGTGTGEGIYAYERYSITIKNGRIWGFGNRGIALFGYSPHQSVEGAGHRIENIQAMNNAEGGIDVIGGGLITDCIANNNGEDGIEAYNSTVTNCTANRNVSNGIEAYNSTVTNCTTNKNTSNGIRAHSSKVTQCTANYNSECGIRSIDSFIKDCEVHGNSSNGIWGSDGSSIVENNLRHNGGRGLTLGPGPSAYAIRNVASHNGPGNFSATIGNYMPECGVDATDNCNYGF